VEVARRFVAALTATPMDRSELVGLVVPERRMEFADWEAVREMLVRIPDLGLLDQVIADETDSTLVAMPLFENVGGGFTLEDETPIHVAQINLRSRPEYGGWLVSGVRMRSA